LEDKVFPYIRRFTIDAMVEFCELAFQQDVLNNPQNFRPETVERMRNHSLPMQYDYDHFVKHMSAHVKKNMKVESDPGGPRSWPERWL
jgi:hypothetical protein